MFEEYWTNFLIELSRVLLTGTLYGLGAAAVAWLISPPENKRQFVLTAFLVTVAVFLAFGLFIGASVLEDGGF